MHARTRTQHRGRAGFTLVESLISVTLLAILFLAVAQTSSRASDAFDEGGVENALSTTVHRGLEKISQAIEFADGSLTASAPPGPLGYDDVTFQTPLSIEGGEVQWHTLRIVAELEPGELQDGKDNDGDGLIDERRVVLIEDPLAPEPKRTVLASGVAELLEGEQGNNLDDNGNGLKDEPGLSFSSQGNVVTVRLTCQRQDEGRRLMTKTAETAVRLHNSGG